MRLGHAIPAGLADAAFASLATFVAGIFAARTLEAADLGIYSLFFSTFVVTSVLSTQLVFVPCELKALRNRGRERLNFVAPALRIGIGPTVLAAVAGGFIGVLTAPAADAALVGPLALTMAATALLSPIQDHVRRVLHLAGLSWHAAIVSTAQLGAVGGGILILLGLRAGNAWIPFGSLAVANAVSLTLALLFIKHERVDTSIERLKLPAILRSGSWLTVVGLLPAASGLAVATIVVHVAGAATMGYAEAARIVSRPILVMVRGVGAALQPRSMAAAVHGDEGSAKHFRRVFSSVVVASGLGYLAVTGGAWMWNPLPDLLPTAYVVSGLVAVSIFANVVEGIASPYRFELLAAAREVTLTKVEVVGNGLRLMALVAAVGSAGALAVPYSLMALGGVRWISYQRASRDIYAR